MENTDGKPDYTERSVCFTRIQRKKAKICVDAGELADAVARR